MTDELRKKAKQVVVVGNPQINAAVDFTDPSKLPFPYRGVPNVLSPRGVPISPRGGATQEGGLIENFEGGNFRPVPPSAGVVENKRTMDETLAHFSGSASRLRVENRELTRSFKEATEVAEARRLVQAGLVNPSTLDLLLKTNEARHEQERHMDELRLQANEEEDRRRSIELQASNDYLKRLFAVATGELEDTESGAVVQRPSDVRKLQENIREETVGIKRRASAAKHKHRKSFVVKVETADDVPATNLLGGFMDPYVRVRVVEISTDRTTAEAQTRTATGSVAPEWQETLHFEVEDKPDDKSAVVLSLMGYNAVGTDSVIAETAVEYSLFKKSQGSCCWMLPCVVLQEHKNISLFVTTTLEDDESNQPVAMSQAAARQRYWRSQALQDTSDSLM